MKLLAKLFDYSLFFSILYLIGAEIDILNRWVLIMIILPLVPLLWFPIDLILKKLFKTTPGKSFFSSSKTCHTVILGSIIIGAFLCSPLGWDHWHRGTRATITHLDPIDYKNWTAFESTDKLFRIYFPEKSKSKEDELPIPGDQPLKLIEHSATHDSLGKFTIAHTQLPQKWLKYSDKLIIKHSLLNMAENMDNTDLVTRNYSMHGAVQSIDYILKSQGNDVLGRMMLINGRLYKIEMQANGKAQDEALIHQQLFINSFQPLS